MKNRMLSMLLAIAMVVGLMPSFTLTASAATVSGQCGTNATYTLTDDGVLTVSGTGAIEGNAFGSLKGATFNKGFTDYLKIQKVVIGEGITEIGMQAFIECSNITSVALPSTITKIQENAFSGCTKLRSINLPEGLTSIRSSAFSECTGLTEITIPSTLTSLGTGAFQDCTSLKTVILSEGMTATIPQYVFWRAILTDITIPASVTKIAQEAFWAASKLKNVTIKNKEITLGEKSFSASDIVFTVPCDFDKNKITAAVVNNNSFTFSSDSLHIDADNDGVCDAEGCGAKTVASVSLNTNNITLTSVGATKTLTATITSDDVAADLAWRSNNSAVATVSDNGTVTAVGAGTATITVEAGGKTAKCTVTVDLPKNPVTGVSLSQTSLTLAIGDTYELDAIIAPENADIKTVTWSSDAKSVATVDSDGIVTAVAAGTANITVTTQDGGQTATCAITVLADHNHDWNSNTGACSGCSLTHDTHGNYTWSNGVCSICGVTGGYCGYVNQETEVEYILTSTDSGSTYTLTIYGYGKMGEYNNDSSNPPWYDYREKITSVMIQNGVPEIGWGAFKNHTALKSVSIPSSVTEIKHAAFLGASSLESITLPNNVTVIGKQAFKNSGLTSIAIPSSVTKIQGSTFNGCTNLTSVTLPNSITEIEGSAFQQCSALTSIHIPNGVTSIGDWAFNQSGLTSVEIPGSVTSLGMHAFSGCSNLKTVTISGTNLAIAERAFQGDEALEALTVRNTGAVSIGDYAFMIDAASGDDTNVDIGGGEIEGWESEEGGSAETDPVSLASNERTGNDTTESRTITKRADKLYSITLPTNVTYATDYATSFKNRVRSISIAETATVDSGSSIKLTPVFTPDTAVDQTITWKSDNEDVATVDSNGTITGVSEGETTITATAKYQLNGVSRSASCTVNVVSHTHNWTYALKEGTTDTIEAICGNGDGYCPDTNGGSVTIVAPHNLVYTGSAIEATVTNTLTTGDTVTVVYTPADKLTDEKPVNAGTYTASITLGDKTASVDYTITQKPITPTVTLSDSTFGYDGTAKTPAVTVMDGGTTIPASEYSVSYDNNINAGTGTVTVTAKENGNYGFSPVPKTFTIEQATPDVTVDPINKTYSGAALTNDDISGETDVTGKWSWKDDNAPKDVADSTSNSKTWTVVFTPDDTANYKPVEKEVTVTITAKPLTITGVTAADRDYAADDTTVTLTGGTLQGVEGSDTVSFTLGTGTMSDANAGVNKAVTTSITLTGTAKDNYTLTQPDVKVTIHKIDPNYTVPTGLTAIYGQTLAEVSLSGHTGWSWKDATTSVGNVGSPSFDAVFTPSDTTNYNTVENIPVSVTVNKAAAPTGVTATKIRQSYTVTYGTADLSQIISGMPEDAGTISYAVNAESVPSNCTASIGDDGKTFSFAVPGPGTVGMSYKFPVIVSSTNYADVTVQVTVEIVDKEQKNLTVTMTGWTYGETANAPSYPTAEGAGTATVKYAGRNNTTYADSTVVPTNAGDYTVTVTYETKTEVYTGTAEFTIAKAQQTVTAADVTVTYGDTDKSVSATGIGNVTYAVTTGADVVSVDNDGKLTILKAGTAAITATAAGDTNHEKATETIAVTVNKATPTVTTAPTATVTYGKTIDNSDIQGAMSVGGTFKWKDVSSYGDTTNGTPRTLTATFTPTDTTNYNTVENIPVSVTVNKASYGNQTATGSAKYGGSNSVDLSNLIMSGGELSIGTVSDTASILDAYSIEHDTSLKFVFKDNATVGEQATITVNVTNSTNYTDYTITVTLTVNDKLTPTVTAPTAIENLTYNGGVQTLITAGSTTGGTLQYSLDNNTWSETLPTGKDADTYTLYYKVVGNADYADTAVNSIPVTIGKKAVTVKPKSYTITEGDTIPAFALEYDGLVDGDTLNSAAAPAFTCYEADGNTAVSTSTAAGSYTITWTNSDAFDFTNETNYTVSKVETGTLTINSKPSSGSGGGGGGSSSSGTTITVPVSSDHASVQVKAEVKKGNATVEVSDKQIEQVAADGAGSVTLDVSGLKNVTSATVPAHVVEKTNEAEDTGLTVALPAGSVTLDETALYSVTEMANGKDVTISVVSIPTANLSQTIKDIIGMEPTVAAVVDVNVYVNGQKQSSFDGGKLTISIPYTPKSGEDTSKLTVWFIRDDGRIENKGGYYDAENQCFVFETEHLSQYLLVSTDAPVLPVFTDVPDDAYYADAVTWAVLNGITTGMTETTFGPAVSCTRAQIVTFLWRAAGEPEPTGNANPFTDVTESDYFYQAVLWAVENGITTGVTETSFAPSATCTRAQAAAFLYRNEQANGGGFTGSWMFKLPFTDVPEWCYEAVAWCYMNGITQGTSETTFSPNGDCTRAQMVTMLYRLLGK